MDPIQNQSLVENENKKSFGPIVGIIVIIVLIILGAFYLFGNKPKTEEAVLPPVSTSDDVGSIQQDLNAGSGADINLDTTDIENSLK